MKRWMVWFGAPMLSVATSLPTRAEEPTAAPVASETCTLTDCVRLAIRHAPELLAATAAVEAGEGEKKQARGHYLPLLKVDGGVQIWDSPLEASFGNIPGIPITVPPFKVRDTVTWSVNLTLAQPLTGLWTIGEANELKAIGVDVAQLELRQAEREAAMATTEAWLQAALTEDLVAIAESSVAARSSDAARAKALVDAGVLVAADASRAELGVLDAKQKQAQAQRQRQLARVRLTQLVGAVRAPNVAGGGAAKEALPASLEEAKRGALTKRFELKQIRARIAQADAAVDLATSQMLPSVNLVAQAQFAGGSEFNAKSAAFVGLQFEWNAWDWGATYYGIDTAKAHVREARARLQQAEEGIGLEVEAAWVEVQSAAELATLAGQARAVAETHYQLVEARLAARTATGFDVVEAETSVATAKSQERLAVAQTHLARARLVRALGGGPEDIAREGTP